MTLVDVLLAAFIFIGIGTCIQMTREARKTDREIKELQKLIEDKKKELEELKGGSKMKEYKEGDKPPLMKCGCVAQATTIIKGKKYWLCALHYKISDTATEDSIEPMEQEPDLSARKALCPYCMRAKPSSIDLAFFEHRPDKETDLYYCGCRGWD